MKMQLLINEIMLALQESLIEFGLFLYYQVLLPQAMAVAVSLLPLIVAAEIAFVGFRIMSRAPIVQQMQRLVLIATVCSVLLFGQGIQEHALMPAMFGLDAAGRTVATHIIESGYARVSLDPQFSDRFASVQTALQNDSGIQADYDAGQRSLASIYDRYIDVPGPDGQPAERLVVPTFAPSSAPRATELRLEAAPAVAAWYAWLGDPAAPAAGHLNGLEFRSYKLSPQFAHGVIFGGYSKAVAVTPFERQIYNTYLSTGPESAGAASAAAPDPLANPAYDQIVDRGLESWLRIKRGEQGELRELFRPEASLGNSFASFLLIFQPAYMLSIMLTLGMASVSIWTAPGLAAAAVLGMGFLGFFLVMGLGVAMLPAMFFRQFERIWDTWLRLLVGLALVPFFFHITSAIGFVFMARTFDILFPVGGAGLNVAIDALMKQAMAVGLQAMLGSALPGAGGAAGSSIADMLLGGMMAMFLIAGRVAGGVAMVGFFVSAGVGFGTLASSLAFAWDRAFAETGIMRHVHQSLMGVASAVSSTVSQTYGGGAQAMGEMFGSQFRHRH